VDKLQKIKALGHEIGYHYEDMDPAKGDAEKAITSFEENLAKLRKLAPIGDYLHAWKSAFKVR